MALRTSKAGSSTLCRTFSWLYAKQTVPFSQGFPSCNTNQKVIFPLEERIECTSGKSSIRYLEAAHSGSSLNLFLRQNVDSIIGKEGFGMNLTGCTETRSTTLQDCFLAWKGGLNCSLSRGSSQSGHGPAQLQQQRTFVQLKTKLTVADNSGAKVVECIKVMNKTRGARLGDKIIASVKEVVGRGKVKKGEVVYCVIVRARMKRGRCDGSEVRFDDNAVVLINKQGEPIGTRIMGPVCHELREKKMVKVLSLAEYVA